MKLFRRLGKRIFAVADSRQQIYEGENPSRTLRSSSPAVERLRFHYRNGRRICELADALAKDTTAYKPRRYDMFWRRRSSMEKLLQDLRYALRTLRKNPAFAAAAVLTLALGIGANTAIFSVVQAVLIAPLPYADPDRLCAVHQVILQVIDKAPSVPVRARDFLEWQRTNTVFSGMSALGQATFNLTGDGEPERLGAALVSANFFSLLGVQPARGRSFLPEEDQPGRERVVILSHELWVRRFAADPAILNRTLSLDGQPHIVAGILPAGFLFPSGKQFHPLIPFASRIDIWKPIAFSRDQIQAQGNWNYGVMARLKPDSNLGQARQEMNAITDRIVKREMQALSIDLRTQLVPIQEVFTGNIRQPLVVLLVAVGLLLLVASVNLANLLLARVASRAREFATRAALGAGRSRLVRQMLTESLLIACLGGAAGIAIASWGTRLLLSFGPSDIPRLQTAQMNGAVLLFALGVALLTGIAFGLIPALETSGKDLSEDLKEGARSSTAGPRADRFRRILVATEVALSTALAAAAGLLLHSYIKVMHVDKGFAVERVLSVDLALPRTQHTSSSLFYREIVGRLRALPGVISAGAISDLPLSHESNASPILLESDVKETLDRPIAVFRSVTPGYFATMSIPLRAGRFFTEQENTPVVVISEGLARRLWPGEPLGNAIGRRVRRGTPKAALASVVGVVGEVRTGALDREPLPQSYMPHGLSPAFDMSLVVRTAQDPLTLAPAIRSEIRMVDKDVPVPTMKTMREIVSAAVAQRRFQMVLIVLFGVLALALTLVGVYGVVSYSVACQTREIGLRMALGAQQADVLRSVVARGLRPVLAGLVCGLAGAMVTAIVLRKFLFGIAPHDPLTLAGVVGLLLFTSSLACYLPARRASRVDPMVALRHE